MNRSVIALVFAALVGGIGVAWLAPGADAVVETAPATDVAVHVGKVTRTTLRAYVTAYGVVAPEPAGDRPAASAIVAPFVPGVVVAVNGVEGQQVAKGMVLFQLDSRAADLAAAFAEKTLDRQEQLLPIQATSERDLQDAQRQLDAARLQQALLRVESPLAGTLTRVHAKLGDAVDSTTVMAEVVDLDRLVVRASVPTAELAALEVGQPAQIVSEGGASPSSGSLSFVGPDVDVQTGTAEARVELPSGSSLRPGQFVTVRIVSAEHTDTLAVPVESVVKDAEGTSVIAIVDGETARQMAVKTGLRDDGLIEVEADGLRADMTVVTEGAYGLPKQTKVRVVEN